MRRRGSTALCVLVISALAVAGQAATSKVSPPPSSTYVVKSGDTLSSIADRFGTTVSAIATANNVRNRNVLVVGRRLTVPGGTGPSSHRHGVLPTKLQAHPERLALRPLFQKWASHYGIPPDLVQAVAWIESGWQTAVVSKTGAIGVGQLEPATIDFMRLVIGIKLNPLSANDNIRMSARFLRYLLDRTGNNVPVSVAAYYQGLRSVTNGVSLPDTWLYVANVLAVRPSFA